MLEPLRHLLHNDHGELTTLLAQWPMVRHYAITLFSYTRDRLRRIRRR